MSDAYGSEDKPVSLDPFGTIVEVGWPSIADLVIIRCGTIIGAPTLARAAGFRRATPGKRTDQIEPEQSDSKEELTWVGAHMDPGTTWTPANPESKFWRRDPYRTGGTNEEITGGFFDADRFPLQTPSTDQWGAKDDAFNPGAYLWHCGWANGWNNFTNQSCLVNCRKLRHDYKQIKAPPQKDVALSSMSITVVFDAIGPGTLSDNLVEFAAYRFESGYEGDGSFFLLNEGSAYANSVNLIVRKVVRPQAVLLPQVDFTYNFKKEITFSGGTEISQQEYGAFTSQPGG